MEFALWSRAAVMQLIEREYGIRLSVRGVGNYLQRWGFTPQKPIRRAYEQRSEAVQKWLDEEYPPIAQRAGVEGGEIHWGDETAPVNTDVHGRSYALAGKTPVAYAVGGIRQQLSMIATVTNQGKARWMITEEAFNSDKLIEFLKALIKDASRKVFLILDNLRVHHSKPVKAWLAENREMIDVFYLPSYSPELNPEERLNADLKHAIGAKVPAEPGPNRMLPPMTTRSCWKTILNASNPISRTPASSMPLNTICSPGQIRCGAPRRSISAFRGMIFSWKHQLFQGKAL
ncbi:Winged helix-turn helix [Nitrosospira multiformis]|uniref:Winged helix-turn helix n=1 Tax=Nitrosospira multiformis TaxID=1231 RepID=A0A1I7GFN6_9PROT|nr:Winged helix-turn helix [Nitrosospira multiformis]